MSRLLLLILFIPYYINGQIKIQHEPESIFNELLNKKNITEFAKENKLREIKFLRDTILSSSIEFDKNGNSIRKIGMENDYVRETKNKFDNQDREIETNYFKPNGEFSYGYYYKYENGAQLMYKIEDSLLFRKETFLKSENISTYSEYDENGKIILKDIYVKDQNMKWLLETRFQDEKIYIEYRYEYLGNKTYVTKVQFDNNGTKVSEKRHLDEIKTANGLEHFTDEEERLFRIDLFNKNGDLIEKKLLDEKGNPTLIETYIYNSKGQLTELIKKYLSRNQKIVYTYKYDKFERIELVKKEFGEKTEVFKYLYDTF